MDNQKLYNITVKYSYAFPRIDAIFDMLGKSCYFLTIDLKNSYFQIPIAIQDRDKTAFYGLDKLYQFKKMPFGLLNAPKTFQQFMNSVLKEHIEIRCLVYLDNIIVYSNNKEVHYEDVKKVIESIKNYNLEINYNKSLFYKKRVKFLGHIISRNLIQSDSKKVLVI